METYQDTNKRQESDRIRTAAPRAAETEEKGIVKMQSEAGAWATKTLEESQAIRR